MLTGGLKTYTLTEPIGDKQSNKYQYDFEYLATLCEKTFPHIDSVFPQPDRNQLRKAIYQQLGAPNTTELAFKLEATRYLAHFQNQHTAISLNYTAKQLFGYNIFIANNKWLLSNIDKTAADSSALGKEIIALNDQPVAVWQAKLQEYVFGEHEAARIQQIAASWHYNKPEILQYIGLIKNTDLLKITLADGTNIQLKSRTPKELAKLGYKVSIKNHPITKHAGRPYHYALLPNRSVAYFQFNACFDKVVLLAGIKDYVSPMMLPVAKAYLNYQFHQKKPIAFIARSYHPDYPAFKEFLKELFEKIQQNKIDTLVLDLRNNGGGDFHLPLQVLYHLTNRTDLKDFTKYIYTVPTAKFHHPKEYKEFEASYREKHHREPPPNEVLTNGFFSGKTIFETIEDKKSIHYIAPNRPIFKGKVFILTDENTGSAAALFTALLQDNGIATIIGSSVSNNPTGTSAYTPYKLPKTKIGDTIASLYIVRPEPSRGKIQHPDIEVSNSFQEIIDGKDRIFERVFLGKQ
jgi:Peptidase family S41